MSKSIHPPPTLTLVLSETFCDMLRLRRHHLVERMEALMRQLLFYVSLRLQISAFEMQLIEALDLFEDHGF